MRVANIINNHNFNSTSIVYCVIYDELKRFYQSYAYLKCIIGYSIKGREIFAFHVGSSFGKQFISTYAIHGREWVTAYLALKHIKMGTATGGWIIPLVNPDGAVISQTDKPLWKANARGVDLNCNFDADWGSGRQNVRVRGSQNCIGDYPFSEPESIALRNFTLKVRPFVTFSWHTKGEEIYWSYAGRGDSFGADILQRSTGYDKRIIYGSAGGYKDWCIKELRIPSYTIECASDKLVHPIKRISKLKPCFKALKIFTENYR